MLKNNTCPFEVMFFLQLPGFPQSSQQHNRTHIGEDRTEGPLAARGSGKLFDWLAKYQLDAIPAGCSISLLLEATKTT